MTIPPITNRGSTTRPFSAFALATSLGACALSPASPDPIDLTSKARGIARQAELAGDDAMAILVLEGVRAQGHATPDMLLDEARLLARTGNVEAALALAGVSTPIDPSVLRLAANERISRGDAAGALKMLELRPSAIDALTLNTRAAAFEALGRMDEALSAYRIAAAEAPQDTTIAANFALALVLADRVDEAAATLAIAGPGRLASEGRFWEVALVQVAQGDQAAARKTLNTGGRYETAATDVRWLQQIMTLPSSQRRRALRTPTSNSTLRPSE